MSGPAAGGRLLAVPRRAWRRLLRMSTALALLGALATAAAVATFVPQEPVVPDTVAAWRLGSAGPGPLATALLDAAALFDVFGAWWFMLLLGLLLVSLAGCMTLRVAALARAARRPPAVGAPPTRAPDALVPVGLPPDAALDAAVQVLARRRFRVAAGDGVVAASRGAVWREGGSLAFHLSLYVLLAGAVAGHTLGFSGQVDLAEGRGFTDTRISYDTVDVGRLAGPGDHRGVLFTLERFALAVHPDGTPADYVATVAVGRGEAARVEQVRINQPVREDGVVLHLVRYGLAPELVVRDATGRAVFRDAVRLRGAGSGAWGGLAKVRLGEPADATQLALEVTVLPTAAGGTTVVDPRAGASAALPEDPLVVVDLYAGDLGLEQAVPLSQVRPAWGTAQLAARTAVRAGERAALGPDHTVELERVATWAGFQASRTPGQWLLVAGALLMLAGLAVSLYAYRRQLWVVARPGALAVHGRAWQRHERAAQELADLAAELGRACADTSERASVGSTGGGA